MKLTVVGTGYVGLVTGACLADMGNHVFCLDVDSAKVAALNAGKIPIYEPGLEAVVRRNASAGRLSFSTDVAAGVKHGVLQLIAVGTPPGEDGSADMQYVLEAARAIGRHMDDYRVVVNKSTVPVGTADRVRGVIDEELSKKKSKTPFSVVSNPEFLKEGAAVEDFMRPDRIIVGSDDERATALLRELYAPFQRNHDRLMLMGVRSAELTKYAANAMLATRISFMNELANLAEGIGADIEEVRRGIGADPRIGTHFLYPGAGFGGSCFPKDVKALQRIGQDAGRKLRVVAAVEEANEAQKRMLGGKIKARFGDDLKGRRFAVWGLAFKPNTDDLREAPSLTLIADLLAAGAEVSAYDPVAKLDEPKIRIASSAVDALRDCDALAIVTEWAEFRAPDFAQLKKTLKTPAIFDGRNLYDPAMMRAQGFEYFPVGRRILKTPDTRKTRILVVGDVMLDRYWFGDALRISPEAPVPVVLWRKEETKAGGAANVAGNCAALGARTRLFSVVGDDPEGRTLEGILVEAGVDVNFQRDKSIQTTQKLRVIGGRQHQLLRIDFETQPSREVLASKLVDFEAALPGASAVILSDYGKGGLAHIGRMIGKARAAGKCVLVDPKGDDWSRYKGASVVTPNRAELRQVVGAWKNEKDLERRAQKLRRQLGLEALLVTRGEEGMSLYRQGRVLHVKAEKHEVFDVSGAGDTVIATLATMLAAGLQLEQATRLANRAAGIKVMKFGTAAVSKAELFGK